MLQPPSPSPYRSVVATASAPRPWQAGPGLPPPFFAQASPPVAVYVPVTPPKLPAQGAVRDGWLEMWLQRNREQAGQRADEPQSQPRFDWRAESVKGRLREVATLLEAIKNATEPQDISAKEHELARLLAVFDDEDAYTRFKNRMRKTERNKRWQKRKREERIRERAVAPSKADIEREAEERRVKQEAIHLAEVTAKKKQAADRIEGRQKRKRAQELDYKVQIAARLEVLLRLRRLKKGVPEPITYFEEVKRAEDERQQVDDGEAQDDMEVESSANDNKEDKVKEGDATANGTSPSKDEREEKRVLQNSHETNKEEAVCPATPKQTDEQRPEGTETKRTRKKRRSEATVLLLEEDYVPPDYRQTSRSSETLQAIRRGWGVFAVPKGTPGASAIPPDMLRATPPSSREWERRLKQRPPHLSQPAATNAHRRHSHHHRKHPPSRSAKGRR